MDAISKLIADHGLSHLAARLEAAARPGIRLVREPGRPCPRGASRLGGIPDVPAGFCWPQRGGRPLTLLAQIACTEASRCDASGLLPGAGTLYFFYDAREQPWGFDPKDRGGVAVIYAPAGSLAPACAAEDAEPGLALSACPLGFGGFPSFPSPDSAAIEAMGLCEDDLDAYLDLHQELENAAFGEHPRHQILGHPSNIQGEMALECQLVAHGLYCGDGTGLEDPRAVHLAPGAADWRLLLQVDSDDDLGAMWGDDGMVYFWIREPDLRRREFDSVWAVLQCY